MAKICQYCSKREAKIHFTEIKDGKKTEMHICEPCAHEKDMALAFPSILSTLVPGAGPVPKRPGSEAVPATCPSCQLAYNEFKSKGRLGCPTCYDVFAPVLVPLLEKVHGAAAHAGKTPARAAGAKTRQEVLDLEAELERAIEAEDYERAAELRDSIRSQSGAVADPPAEEPVVREPAAGEPNDDAPHGDEPDAGEDAAS